MKISFIIVNYQSQQFLKRCIESIYEHAPFASYEIIIANNDASELEDFFTSAAIKTINNRKNVGFARACNAAARQCEGEILFFLNPDTEITTSNIDDIASAFDDPAVGIVSPQLITPSGAIQLWSTGREITFFRTIANNFKRKKSPENLNNSKLNEVDWVSGGALAISKKLFSECQGFDEKFFLYFEDVDLCRRVRSLGKKIMLLPFVKVLHIGGQSIPDPKKQKQLYYQSQDYYFKKNFGTISAFFIKILRKLFVF
jgi:GT2 family glycosyltransferase